MKVTEDNEELPNSKGLKTPDILINDDDWYERSDNEAWIGLRYDEATNTNTEYWLDDEYFHHILDDKFIDRFMKF